MPVRIVTLLYPTENVNQEAPPVKIIQRDGESVGLMLAELAEVVLFGDSEPAVERVPSRISTNLSM